MSYELNYRELVQSVIDFGQTRICRNGETRALFGQQLIIDELQHKVFPILTQRQIFYKGVLGELAAFVRGATTVEEFKRWGCNYWDANAAAWRVNRDVPPEDHEIGQVYGAQWTNWECTGFNQIKHLLINLREDPHGRRHVLTTYSPTAQACLPPCHLLTQFFVNKDQTLDCTVYMRSVDLIHGLPSDVVLYAALLIQVAGAAKYFPGRLIFFLGDTHVYENHISTWNEQQLHNSIHAAPTYKAHRFDPLSFEPSDMYLINYKHSGKITYDFNV